ncbi:MAG TPA: hypothetical protein VJT49_29390 [Amycolatopsis sp.]|uniref:hypothetical protein n=1 Tax=Amycolatopsis sp. TaxID=37632 RepID=UPI002B46C01C|nr:hypothetical protein [Amycolatopsis sp.]HKS49153.1 hypothetical protein [Amycolatopsis sp.]
MDPGVAKARLARRESPTRLARKPDSPGAKARLAWRESGTRAARRLVGAGQVGRGSLYGTQALYGLAAAGWTIWPFRASKPPVVVEVYPRLPTGPVTKSDPAERAVSCPRTPGRQVRHLATASEDAFDAAMAALGMAAGVTELTALPERPDYALEGMIWPPENAR